MKKTKSPFLIFQDAVSPLMCEKAIMALNLTIPDIDQQGRTIVSYRHNDLQSKAFFEVIEPLIPQIEQYYNIEYKGTEVPQFEWYSEGVEDKWHCGNSAYLRKQWVRVKDRDLTGIIFLNQYQETPPFDDLFEVCGGKFEFPQHHFSFNPERGTMILFPSTPHFLHRVGEIFAGESIMVKFHIAAQQPFLYDPAEFPGSYETWLTQFMD